MHFDDLLKILGELGRYQKIRLFLISLVSIVCAFHAFNMAFVGGKPSFKCITPKVNLTGSNWENVTENDFYAFLGNVSNNKKKRGCSIFSPEKTIALVENGNSTFQELVHLGPESSVSQVTCDDWEYSQAVYGPTIVSEFDLVCDRKWLTSMSKTLYFFGRLLGAVVFGQLSDIFGRRPMYFLGLLLLLIAGCVASASPNIYVFLPFYILQGAAQTGLFLVAFTMCTELVGPTYRVHAGFLIQGFYSIGFMSLSLIAYFIRDWRYIEVAITVPVVVFAFYWCFLTESVRWLLSKNKIDKAREIVKKVAEVNKVNVTDDMLADLTDKRKDEAEQMDGRKYSIIDLFKTCKMAILSFNVWFNWLVNALVYYGLSLGSDNLGGDPYINLFIAGAVEIPAYILCVLLLNRLGRKKPLCATMIAGGIACIISGFLSKGELEPVKITFAMIGKFMITISYAIIYLMAAEVFPTVVRNIGMGVSSMSARIGGMLAPQILELGNLWGPLTFLVFGGLSFVAGILALLLPETAGKPLPQTIEDVLHPKKSIVNEVELSPPENGDLYEKEKRK